MRSVREVIDSFASKDGTAQPLSLSKSAGSGRKSGAVSARLVSLLEPRSSAAECYSRLRFAIEKMHKTNQGLVVGVTSPGEGDGKTLTALNLAGALAQGEQASVVLVELDFRARSRNVTGYLDLKTLRGYGLIDWIRDEGMTAEEITRYLPGFNLRLIVSGGRAELPYELLNSPRLATLLNDLRHRYDYIILDTPKCTELPDIELVSRFVDGFLVVVRAGFTAKKMLAETLDSLGPEKVVGLVFNGL